jgi:hypothetical protein
VSEAHREVLARADAELAEHLVQVVLDGALAGDQPSGDVRIGAPFAREAGDVGLLRREVAASPCGARAEDPRRNHADAGELGMEVGTLQLPDRLETASPVHAASGSTRAGHAAGERNCRLRQARVGVGRAMGRRGGLVIATRDLTGES